MTLKTSKWDIRDYLDNPKAMSGYLEAAFEDGDASLIRAALNDVARAKGISNLERETGLTRNAIYKAFGENGNPTLDTLLKVTKALGVRLSIAA